MLNVEATCAFLCDDIRREDNNKIIAIGIYGSDVNVALFPAALQFSMLVKVFFTTQGKHKISLRVQTKNGTKHDINGEMVTVRPGSDLIAITLPPMIFESSDEISVLAESKSGRWKNILVTAVISPAASPPHP